MSNDRVKALSVDTPQGHAGRLDKEARFVFNYETGDRAAETSLALPIRAQSYSSGDLFSVFQMNKPEGYLLDYIRNRFSKSLYLDDMMLLKLTGENQIGRLTYHDMEDTEQQNHTAQVSLNEIITSSTSEEIFEFLVDTYFSSGISGFQPKVIVPVTDKRSVPTTEYIVKSAGEDYPYLAQNEFMCMEVARLCNFNVPEFWLSDDRGLFIMERFDRMEDGSKVGLEDMAVLMGKSPDEKYNSSYEMVAKVVDTYCGDNAPESKARLFEYIALSVLLRNGDAHLKNFSLVYDTPGGDVKLSPLYDVVTTNIYEIENPKTGATKVDNMMALNMFKAKSYPSDEELITYGKNICMVKQPERVIELIEEAKHSVIKAQTERMNKELIEKLKKSWRIY